MSGWAPNPWLQTETEVWKCQSWWGWDISLIPLPQLLIPADGFAEMEYEPVDEKMGHHSSERV